MELLSYLTDSKRFMVPVFICDMDTFGCCTTVMVRPCGDGKGEASPVDDLLALDGALGVSV